MVEPRSYYYEARGFGIYYFANAVSNIVRNVQSYLRGVEDILGDMQSLVLMRPFHEFTNLHHFLREIVRQIVEEEVDQLDVSEPRFIVEFLHTYDVPFSSRHLESDEQFYDFASESEGYQTALDELTDEVFHVLFGDVLFLQKFNHLCADYIQISGFGEHLRTEKGTLRRVTVPAWAKRAIFHRDKGACRSCKKSLAGTVTQIETERYDHIIPLAAFGANDVTNLQLLCEPCNTRKAAQILPVSTLYPKAILKNR